MTQAELFRLYPERQHPKPPPAKLKLTPFEPAEADVLSSALEWLNFCPLVAWAERFNSGAGKLLYPDGSSSQFMRWGFPGCPDILGQLKQGGRLLVIECKRRSGRIRPEQAAFLAKVNANGGLGFICRGIDDLKLNLG